MQSNHEHPTRVNIKYRSHSFFTNKKEKNRARDLNDILGFLAHIVFLSTPGFYSSIVLTHSDSDADLSETKQRSRVQAALMRASGGGGGGGVGGSRGGGRAGEGACSPGNKQQPPRHSRRDQHDTAAGTGGTGGTTTASD